jgi:alpha-tubulin suppressor-like RCC1 family protein
VVAGRSFSCALTATGFTVACWGENIGGAFGPDDMGGMHTTPLVISSITGGVTSIAAGLDHVCGIQLDGSVVCFGGNDSGQLGAQGTNLIGPVNVSLGLPMAQAVAAGGASTCMLAMDGTVYCWGDITQRIGIVVDGGAPPNWKPLHISLPSSAVNISVGYTHACAVLGDGTVWCWGDDTTGELGDGTVGSTGAPVAVQNVTSATKVGAGNGFTCAIVKMGTTGSAVQCWGDNTYGQLGGGSPPAPTFPAQVNGLPSSKIDALAAGYEHVCALADGALYCWGDDEDGQLGNARVEPTDFPFLVPISERVVSFAVGGGVSGSAGTTDGTINFNEIGHTCAELASGHIVCWGINDFAQLGDTTTKLRAVP